MMASSLFATTYTWAGASSGNINDSTQWTPTATGIPAWNNVFYIETAGTNVTQTANVNVGYLEVGSLSGAPAVFNMSHNISSNNGQIAVGAIDGHNGVSGTINQTAGEFFEQYNGGGAWVRVMIGCLNSVTGNTGIYNFGGPSPGPTIYATGSNTISSPSGILIGGGTSNHGTLSLSGYGTINLADPIYIGTLDSWGTSSGNGTLNITGGNVSINVGALYAGGHVSGSSIVAGGTTAALNETINSTGISTINATTVRIDTLATLSVTLSGVSPSVGDVYTLIQSTNPITGTFAGLTEGGYLQSGSQWFTISYQSDKVTITAIATPTSIPAWLQEGFSYTSGASITGQNGGTGFASGSSWTTTSSDTVGTGLTYTGLATAGAGALQTGGYGTNTREINSIPGTIPYYMSMLINMHGHTTVRCGPELRVSGADGCLFGRVTGGWGMFSGGGQFGISTSSGSYHTWTGVTAAADSATHLLVYKFDPVAKTVSMWVDPTVSTTIPSPDAVLSTGTVDPTGPGTWTVNLGTSFNEIRIFHEQAGDDLDELRFGAYWQAVLPAPLSTVSTLSDLALSSGTLSPTFATGTTSYTASVSNATSSLTVTPTVTDTTATVKVNGTTVTSGSASGSISLSVGTNTITTLVTAQDGVTTTTYTTTVTRAAANSYTAWVAGYPGLSDSTPTGNPSGDGITNLVKYALDLNPTVSTQPAGTHSGSSLSFTKGTMAKGDSNIAYAIEESTDLVTWGSPTLGSVSYGDTITYTYPSGQAKVFARLKVVQTP